MILPYVYKLTHRETGEFYIGYRSVNKVRSEFDLGFKYFSSSKRVKELGFENFYVEIVAEFFDHKDAYQFEQESIKENFKDPLCLNKSFRKNGKKYFSGFKGFKHSPQTKEKLSEIFSGDKNPNFAKTMTIHQKEKLSKSKTGLKLSVEVKAKVKIKYNKLGDTNPFYGKKHKDSTLYEMKQKLRIFSPSEEILIYAKYKSGVGIKDITLEYSDRIKTDKSIRKILRRFNIVGINCEKNSVRDRGNSINKIFSDAEEYKIFVAFSCGLSRRKILEVYSDRCSKATINTIITKYNNKFNLTQGVVSP